MPIHEVSGVPPTVEPTTEATAPRAQGQEQERKRQRQRKRPQPPSPKGQERSKDPAAGQRVQVCESGVFSVLARPFKRPDRQRRRCMLLAGNAADWGHVVLRSKQRCRRQWWHFQPTSAERICSSGSVRDLDGWVHPLGGSTANPSEFWHEGRVQAETLDGRTCRTATPTSA